MWESWQKFSRGLLSRFSNGGLLARISGSPFGLRTLWRLQRRRGWLLSGSFLLPPLLVAVLSYACATTPPRYGYRVKVPVLQAAPMYVECTVEGNKTDCLLLLLSDYQELVRELKSACIALGGSKEECETDLTPHEGR